eukprot:2785093-Pyramimonas_sp.AAC.1
MAYESSEEDDTVQASPSEVHRNLQPQPDLMPGNRPTPTYPLNYADLTDMESQAFVAGGPGGPFIPPGSLAPG